MHPMEAGDGLDGISLYGDWQDGTQTGAWRCIYKVYTSYYCTYRVHGMQCKQEEEEDGLSRKLKGPFLGVGLGLGRRLARAGYRTVLVYSTAQYSTVQ